jgi:hypothetical protein
MRRVIIVASSALLLAAPARADVREPRASGVELGVVHEVGVWLTTHTKVGATLSRRIWERLYVAISAGAGGSASLVVHEAAVASGLILHPSRSLDVILGWRAGHARFVVDRMDIHAVAIGPVIRLEYALGARWRIQAEPLSTRGYWARAWGFTVGSRLGVEYAF